MNYLREQLPPAFFNDPLRIIAFLRSEPASKPLLPQVLDRAGVNLTKSEYFLLAQQMKPEEIPVEVAQKLDVIWSV